MLRSNKEEIFNEFYAKYKDKLYMWICSREHDELEAEELMQESFYIMYRKLDTKEFETHNDMYKYTIKIAKYLIYNHNRKTARRKEKFEKIKSELEVDTESSPEEIIDFEMKSKDIKRAMKKLSETQRKILIFAVFNKMPQMEIAKKLNLSTKYVKTALHRARKILYDELKEEYPEIKERFNKSKTMKMLIIATITTVMVSGIAYATWKINNYIETKRSFTLEQRDMQINEDSVEISREEAETKIKEYLDIIGVNDYDLEDVTLTQDGMMDSKVWCAMVDNRFKIVINAETGEFIKYNNIEIEYSNKYEYNEKIVTEKILEIVNKINPENNLKLINYNIENMLELNIARAIFAIDETDIYNNSICIDYLIGEDKIQNIVVANNDRGIRSITKDEALEILKENFEVTSIEEIIMTRYIDYSDKEWLYEYQENELYLYSEMEFYWAIKFNGEEECLINARTGDIENSDDEYSIGDKMD